MAQKFRSAMALSSMEDTERPLMNMLIGSYGDKTEKIRAAGGCNVNDSEIKGRVSFIHDHRLEGGPKKSSRCSAVVVVVERRGRGRNNKKRERNRVMDKNTEAATCMVRADDGELHLSSGFRLIAADGWAAPADGFGCGDTNMLCSCLASFLSTKRIAFKRGTAII